jgi:hypothetical protein
MRVFKIDNFAGCTQRAPDQRMRPVADHASHFVRRQFAPREAAQHLIQRGTQIRQAVDEGAVEIEHERGLLH